MNSNWKLLSAGLLVAALAGCGGGSGEEEMETQTPAETCAAMGQGYTLDSDGNCKSLDQAKEEGKEEGAKEEGDKRDQEDAKKQAADDAKAAQKDAKTLYDILAGFTGLTGTDGTPTDATYAVAAKPSAAVFRRASDSYQDSILVVGKAFDDEYDLEEGIFSVPSTTDSKIAGDAFATLGAEDHEPKSANNETFSTPGMYHGVSGIYVCRPATAGEPCVSTKTDTGLTLSAGTWTFKPSNAKSKVTDGKAVEYGWWTTSTGGSLSDFRAYHTDAGTFAAVTGYDFTGAGSATYLGKAAGQYAMHRGVGSENDSGGFTADVELNATFVAGSGEDTISGTVDNFTGADGLARAGWSVDLIEMQIDASTGEFANRAAPAGEFDSDTGKTVWNIGTSSADAAGAWAGNVYQVEAGAAVGPTAASGAFSAEYGNIGNMIGAFGAELDD